MRRHKNNVFVLHIQHFLYFQHLYDKNSSSKSSYRLIRKYICKSCSDLHSIHFHKIQWKLEGLNGLVYDSKRYYLTSNFAYSIPFTACLIWEAIKERLRIICYLYFCFRNGQNRNKTSFSTYPIRLKRFNFSFERFTYQVKICRENRSRKCKMQLCRHRGWHDLSCLLWDVWRAVF